MKRVWQNDLDDSEATLMRRALGLGRCISGGVARDEHSDYAMMIVVFCVNSNTNRKSIDALKQKLMSYSYPGMY
jgi:hypothetical protein